MHTQTSMEFRDGELFINSDTCACGRRHESPYGRVSVRAGELAQVSTAARALGVGSSVCLVADENTYGAAGREVHRVLSEQGWAVKLSMLGMGGGVKPAAEASGAVLLDMDPVTDLFVSVGSGTITDVTRFVAARTGIPFISVPTAPSVDAYTSTTSPMTHHGFKSSVPGNVPHVILADVNVLVDAPSEMIAAGYGDTVGKLVARCDWQLANLITDEYYCPSVEATVTALVHECAARSADIGQRDPAAITFLTESLMISGAAMTLLESTRPASGSEHALSHYWEMRAGNLGLPAKLHGIKVGVGAVVMSAFWGRVANRLSTVDPASITSEWDRGQRRDLDSVGSRLRPELGPITDILMEQVCKPRALSEEQARSRVERYRSGWEEMSRIAREAPAFDVVAAGLRAAGGPAFPADIGVNSEQLRASVLNALEVRGRFTVLNVAEELGWLDAIIDEVVQLLEA